MRPNPTSAPAPPDALARGAARPRVLVVDGDRSTRQAMTRLLRARGADVRSAGTLDEATQALDWGPDAILLELMLPDGGGLALLEPARRLAPGARVAVVTAAADPALLDAARGFGPDLLRRKPVDFEELAEFLLKPR
jgi:two-component system OmpR family response regulator